MNFKTTKFPTAYGYFDADPAFQVEADAFLRYAQRTLGHTVVSVELARDIYWTNLEAAVVKWSNLINEYEFTSAMTDLIGKPRPLVAPVRPEDEGNISNKLVNPSTDYFTWKSYAFAVNAALGGDYTPKRGVILTKAGQQVYDLKEDLLDLEWFSENPTADLEDAARLWEDPQNEEGFRMRILEVYHWDNSFTTLNFRPRSAINQFVTDLQQGRQGRFNFQFILPVFDDILRAQHLKQTNKMRRSPFTWRIRGTKFYVYPRPRDGKSLPVFIDVAFVPGVVGNGLEGTQPPSEGDRTTSYTRDGVITNLSNVPYGLFEFSSINSIGREWIREYALALCKISLGNIRGKYGSFPIPSDTLTLNGGDMVSQGQGERDALIASLRERLNELTSSAALERKAGEAENLLKIQSHTPPKKPFYIA
jgi:hypothetical protein